MRAVCPVLFHEVQAASVQMLDRGDIDPARVVRSPRRLRFGTQRGHERDRLRLAQYRDPREARRRAPRDDGEGDLRYHTQRSFRPDKEIDQIHLRGREVPRRPLRHGRHLVGGHRDPANVGVGDDLEVPIGMRAHVTACQVENAAVSEDDREAPDPVAHAAVLEGAGACRVGGDDPARERPLERGDGRVERTPLVQRLTEHGQRHTGLHGDLGVPDLDDPIEPLGRQHDLSHRCCPTRQ